MAKPAHTRVTFIGRLRDTANGGTIETWQTSVAGPDSALTDQTALNQLAGDCRNVFVSAFEPILSPDCELTKVEVARIGADGKIARRADGSFLQGIEETDHLFTGPTNYYAPPQTACVVSLRSARAGATGRGRMFLPYPAVCYVGTDRRWSAADTTLIADAAKAFIDAMQLALGNVLVVSNKGYTSPVTSVRVGNVPDTMRSRRASMAEGGIIRSV